MGNQNQSQKTPLQELNLEEHLQESGVLISQVRPSLQTQSLSGGELQTLCFKPQSTENQNFSFKHFVSVPEGHGHSAFKPITKELRDPVELSNKFPNSTYGIVRGTDQSGQNCTGTGVLIGFDLVLTAAHNLMESDRSLLKDLVFIPGASGEFTPFGVFKILDTYFPEELKEDYALLVLDKTIGEKTGFLGLHVANKETLKEINQKAQFSLFGYPGYVGKKDDDGNTQGITYLASNGNHQQWGMKGKVSYFTPSVDGEWSMASYNNNDILTTPGQSGSGLTYERDGQFYIVGVHVMGGRGDDDNVEIYNHSIIINKTRFLKIQEWVLKSRMKLLQKVVSATELDLSSKKIDTSGADLLVRYSENSPLLKLSLRNCDFAANLKFFPKAQFNELKELNLSENNISSDGAQKLADNESWKNLAVLDLGSNSISDDGAISLSYNRSWGKLESLKIGSNKIGDAGVHAIANNLTWSNLTFLELQNNKIGNKGALSLGKNFHWTKLRHLNLSHNLIGDQGALDISKNKSWVELAVIKIHSNPFGSRGDAALSKNPNWPKLGEFLEFEKLAEQLKAKIRRSDFIQANDAIRIELDFSSKALDIDDLKILLNFKLQLLSFLNLANNPLRDSGAAILASNSSWANLQKLFLSSAKLSSSGGVTLSNNVSWKNLQELDLGYNSLGDVGAIALGKSNWKSIEILRIPQNHLKEAGAQGLSQNSSWIRLQSLYLYGNSIGPGGATSLGKNISWVNLSTLDIRNNEIGNDGLEGLSKNSSWKILTKLFLCGNQITDKGVLTLCQNKTWSRLQSLRLSNNKLENSGVETLSQNSWWTEIEELELGTNEVGDDGAKILSQNTRWTKLKVLGLNQNKVSGNGAFELSRNKTWENLEVLNLESNKIGEEAIAALRNNSFWSKFRELNVDTS